MLAREATEIITKKATSVAENLTKQEDGGKKLLKKFMLTPSANRNKLTIK